METIESSTSRQRIFDPWSAQIKVRESVGTFMHLHVFKEVCDKRARSRFFQNSVSKMEENRAVGWKMVAR